MPLSVYYNHIAISVTEYHMTQLQGPLRQARAVVATHWVALPNTGAAAFFCDGQMRNSLGGAGQMSLLQLLDCILTKQLQ